MVVPGNPVNPVPFTCRGCGVSLVMSGSQAPVSGPCPRCGNWIDAISRTARKASSGKPRTHPGRKISEETRPLTKRKSGRGRIRADGFIDYEYAERKELYAILRILAVSVIVLAIILSITFYLKRWMAK